MRRSFFSEFLFEEFGNQAFEDLLADIAFELFANQAGRRFTGTEAGQPGALLERTDDALGLAFHGIHRDRDFERMPATLYQCQWDVPSGEVIFIVAFRLSIRSLSSRAMKRLFSIAVSVVGFLFLSRSSFLVLSRKAEQG